MKKILLVYLMMILLTGCFGEEVKKNDENIKENEVNEEKQAEGIVINVPADYQTIGEAISNAESGDQIVVAPGTYNEDIDFMGKNIKLISSNPSDKAIVETTIIMGSGNGPVVKIDSGEDATAILSGFTITGGNYQHGGGLNIGSMTLTTSPTIRNNIFKNNQATYGGAIYVHISNSLIEDNEFVYNQATMSGGAIHISSQGTTTIKNNIFERNGSETFGGAIFVSMANPTISDNIFTDNNAGYGGGAVSIGADSVPSLSNNSFENNIPDDID